MFEAVNSAVRRPEIIRGKEFEADGPATEKARYNNNNIRLLKIDKTQFKKIQN